MKMAAEDEVDRFVTENWERISKIMRDHRDSIQEFSDFNKDMVNKTFKIAKDAAKLSKSEGERLFKTTLDTITDSDIQMYVITAGMEFISYFEAIVESLSVPDYVKNAARDTKRNVRKAACRANGDCPMKSRPNVNTEAVE